MFEPPMEYCPLCGEYVTLVQSRSDCARRQACSQGDACPLSKAFAVTDFYHAGEDTPSAGAS